MGIVRGQSVWEAESFGVDLVSMTIGGLLDQRAAEFSNKEAIVYNYPEMGLNLRLSYSEYLERVNELGRG
ncbi:MAG TPA: hypothetical protein VJX67_12520, partial [Blastocatellia bacterium]|nr:hypothetical protein [Blastocatellia bacterium]